MEDLAWAVLPFWNGAGLCQGLLSRDEMIASYVRSGGYPVDRQRLFFYEVFSELKVAIIALGIGPRNAAARQSHAHLGNLVFAPLGWRSLARLRDLLGPLVKR